MPNVVRIPVAAGAFDPSDITLTDDTSGALLIKEGSNEYMRIDTTDTQEKTIFKTQSGANTGFFVNVPIVGDALSIIRGGSPATFIRLNAGTTLFQVDSNQILADLISDPRTFKVDGTNVSPLVITGDSNTTFTLDGASAATFKVVDDNASPKTYLSITESTQSYGANPYVHKVTLGDNNGYFKLGNILRANAQSGGANALFGISSYYFGQSKVTVTSNQTYGDFDPIQTPYTMTMGSAATGNVTIDSGFTLRGDYQTGASDIQSFPVLWVFQNDNATHNFILSFDGGTSGLEHTKSGDTDAAALISAGGLTLTPGQRYIVRFQKITSELLLIESVDKH